MRIETIRWGLYRILVTRKKLPIRRIASETYRLRYEYRANMQVTFDVSPIGFCLVQSYIAYRDIVALSSIVHKHCHSTRRRYRHVELLSNFAYYVPTLLSRYGYTLMPCAYRVRLCESSHGQGPTSRLTSCTAMNDHFMIKNFVTLVTHAMAHIYGYLSSNWYVQYVQNMYFMKA